MTTQQFFEVLYADLNGRYLEIRRLPSTVQDFCESIDDAAKIALDERHQNVYFGVGLRSERKGDEEHVVLLPALWADLDWKDYDGGKDEAEKVLGAFEHGPSIVVETGNGWHCYWVLKEPEEVTPDNRPYLRSLLLGLTEALGGDRKCRDLSRILRVPGTYNRKDPDHPKLVRVLKLYPERQYNPGDFDAWSVEDHSVSGGAVGVPTDEEILCAMAGGIREGKGRDNAAFTVARRLAARGLAQDEAHVLLQAWDASNVPPLTESDGPDIIRKKVESAYRRQAERTPSSSSSPPIGHGEGEEHQITLVHRGAADLIQNAPDVVWLVKGILPMGRSLMITGDGGTGKSWLGLSLALAVDQGTSWLSRFACRKGTVLIVDEENGDAIVKRRLTKALRGAGLLEDGTTCGIRFLTMAGVDLSDGECVRVMDTVLADVRPDFVILDTYHSTHHADENSAGEIRVVNEVLKGWMVGYGCAVCLLHHRRKPGAGGDDSAHAYRGSSAIKGFVDSQLDLQELKGDVPVARVRHVKSRAGEPVEQFVVEIVDVADDATVVRYTEEQASKTKSRLEEAKEFIMDLAASGDWVSRKQILSEGLKAGHKRNTLDTARDDLAEGGVAVEEKHTGWHPPVEAAFGTFLLFPKPYRGGGGTWCRIWGECCREMMVL